MKVGILNVQWLNNLGSVLLAYAVQKKLDEMGIENEIINYLPHEYDNHGEIESAHPEEKISSAKKIENYNKFRKNHLRLTKEYIGNSNVDELDYDAYILASDTVWTPLRVDDNEAYVFYFEFCKDKPAKKISWAASIGSESKEDLDMMAPILKERLKNFDSISVRERESVDYVQSLTDKKVFHALDPVLMLEKDDYNEVLSEPNNELGNYIFTYLFDNVEGAYETTNKLSAHTKLPVIANVKDLSRIDNLLLNDEDYGPSDLIETIYNADYIITDAFHVMVYSILAKKPFIAYSRINTSIRLRNLLEDLDLSSKFLHDNQDGFEEILKEIDYEKVYEIINKWRDSTMKFINDSLDVDFNDK